MTDKPKCLGGNMSESKEWAFWGGVLGGFAGLLIGRTAFSSPWAIPNPRNGKSRRAD
jgi:hypothetical protein